MSSRVSYYEVLIVVTYLPVCSLDGSVLHWTGLILHSTCHTTFKLAAQITSVTKNISPPACKLMTLYDGLGKTCPARENRCLDTGDGGYHIPGSLHKLYTP